MNKLVIGILFLISQQVSAQLIGKKMDRTPVSWSTGVTVGKLGDKSFATAGMGLQLHLNAFKIEKLISLTSDFYYLGLSKNGSDVLKYSMQFKNSAEINLTRNFSVGVVHLLGGAKENFSDSGYRLSFKVPLRSAKIVEGKTKNEILFRVDLEKYSFETKSWAPSVVNVGIIVKPDFNLSVAGL